MQSLHDQLIAVVAAFGVLLTSNGLIQSRSLDLANQTEQHGAQSTLAVFVDVLEQDFKNIGSGVASGATMISALSETDFEFYGTSDSTSTARFIAYRKVLSDTSGVSPRYILQRFVNGEIQGQSPELLDYSLSLHGLNGSVITPTNLDEARTVHVRLELPAPFSSAENPNQLLRSVAWESEIAPPNLTRRLVGRTNHPLLSLSVDLESF